MEVALVDDRRDPTGWQSAGEHRGARDWDGYARYPPEGVDQKSDVLNAGDLYRKLLASVSQGMVSHLPAERLLDDGDVSLST